MIRLIFGEGRHDIELEDLARVIGVEGKAPDKKLTFLVDAKLEKSLPNVCLPGNSGELLKDDKSIFSFLNTVLKSDEFGAPIMFPGDSGLDVESDDAEVDLFGF